MRSGEQMTIRIVALVLLALFIAPVWAGESPSPSRPGNNNPIGIDPSENVKALSEAANKRQDDLRAASERLSELRYHHLQELSAAQALKLSDEAKLRAEYAERLAVAEAKRIDAIRAVDVNAVAVASQRAADQATVLAAQVNQSAEALRALVATRDAATAASLQQISNTLSTRLTTLEQAGYQQAGKQTIQDPAFAELLKEVRGLSQSRVGVAAVSEGQGNVFGWVYGAVSFLVLLAGVLIAFLSLRSKGK